jgi:hypothetical protein
MERIDQQEQPQGYVIPDQESAERILAVEAELLRSEGIDPAWPGFEHDSRTKRAGQPDG